MVLRWWRTAYANWWYHGEARGSVLPVLLRGKLFRQVVPWTSGDTVGAPFAGHVPRNESGGVVFITVNQVLVRLWARRGRKSDRMWSASRERVSWGTGPPAAVAMCSEAPVVVHVTGHLTR